MLLASESTDRQSHWDSATLLLSCLLHGCAHTSLVAQSLTAHYALSTGVKKIDMSLCGCMHAGHVVIHVVGYKLSVMQKTKANSVGKPQGWHMAGGDGAAWDINAKVCMTHAERSSRCMTLCATTLP